MRTITRCLIATTTIIATTTTTTAAPTRVLYLFIDGCIGSIFDSAKPNAKTAETIILYLQLVLILFARSSLAYLNIVYMSGTQKEKSICWEKIQCRCSEVDGELHTNYNEDKLWEGRVHSSGCFSANVWGYAPQSSLSDLPEALTTVSQKLRRASHKSIINAHSRWYHK